MKNRIYKCQTILKKRINCVSLICSFVQRMNASGDDLQRTIYHSFYERFLFSTLRSGSSLVPQRWSVKHVKLSIIMKSLKIILSLYPGHTPPQNEFKTTLHPPPTASLVILLHIVKQFPTLVSWVRIGRLYFPVMRHLWYDIEVYQIVLIARNSL